MALSYISGGSNTGSAVSSLDLTLAGGIASDGDLLIACIRHDSSVLPPSGWSYQEQVTGTPDLWVYTRTASTESSASYTFDVSSGTDDLSGVILQYRGQDSGAALEDANSSTDTSPATTNASDATIRFFSNGGHTSFDAPTGHTSRQSAALSSDHHVLAYDLLTESSDTSYDPNFGTETSPICITVGVQATLPTAVVDLTGDSLDADQLPTAAITLTGDEISSPLPTAAITLTGASLSAPLLPTASYVFTGDSIGFAFRQLMLEELEAWTSRGAQTGTKLIWDEKTTGTVRLSLVDPRTDEIPRLKTALDSAMLSYYLAGTHTTNRHASIDMLSDSEFVFSDEGYIEWDMRAGLTAPLTTKTAPGESEAHRVYIELAWNAKRTVSLSNPFTTVADSRTVTVAATGHSLALHDAVVFSDATTVNGLDLEGTYRVASVVDADTFTVTHLDEATGSGSGGGTVPMLVDPDTATFQFDISVKLTDPV